MAIFVVDFGISVPGRFPLFQVRKKGNLTRKPRKAPILQGMCRLENSMGFFMLCNIFSLPRSGDCPRLQLAISS